MHYPRKFASWDFFRFKKSILNNPKEIIVNFNIQLNAEQIAYIGRCLGEKPYQEVVGMINSIQTQVDQQMAAAQSAQPAAENTTKAKK